MRRSSLFKRILLLIISLIVSFVVTGLVNNGLVEASNKKKPAQTEGELNAVDANGIPLASCPLKHTSVKARISGFMSRVEVTQEFENPFSEKIEAVYTFPLPHAAAVDDMTIRIGDRVVRGKIMTREEARATYDAARSSGRVAALLDQERSNIFTQSVANITPGLPIKVTISYVETLSYEEGAYEFTFPMVVGKRYIPTRTANTPKTNDTKADSDPEIDASRISPPRMPKGMRAGHDISIEVEIDAGVPLNSLASTSHEIIVQRSEESRALVSLQALSVIPNKDFTLKYDVAGLRIEDALLTHNSGTNGFFTLILQPPDRVTSEDVMPKELVFVLDTSGSMEGFPLNKARAAVKLALDNLYPQDTFNVITFSGDEHILFPEPRPATPENLRAARKFLDDRDGGGGTEMMKAIKAALDPTDVQSHVRIACFFTDGQVGNDAEIIAEVKRHPNARVFAIGFGDSPNRFLLDSMTQHGLGDVDYVTENDSDAKSIVRRFHERVRNPLLTSLTIEWQGLPVVDVYPQRIPDLFSAKPVTITGRYTDGGRGSILLKGKMSGRDFVREIPIELPDKNAENGVLASLWARRRIDDLMGQRYATGSNVAARQELRRTITQLGIEYRLMTQFTSFVAVEETPTTDTSIPRRVEVPVEDAEQSYPAMVASVITPTAGAAAATVTVAGSGGPTATVQVTSAADVVSTSNTSSTTRVSSFPMNGNLSGLAILVPGIVDTGGGLVSNEAREQLSSNGQRGRSNAFQIDGADANVSLPAGEQSLGAGAAGATPLQALPGGTENLVSSQATSEVSITTRSFGAEFGSSSGAIISVITKAGTNEFHGSLFEYFGNDALDANDWFANSLGIKRPPHRQNNFGGTLGGPLKRDQTFFFFTYEGWRVRRPMVGLTDVPSTSARQLAPPAIQALFNAFPISNGIARPDGFAEFAAGFANPGRLDSTSFRFDHNINNNLSLIVRYNFASSGANERGAGPYSLNTVNTSKSLTQTITSRVNYSVSPTVVVELNGNYSRFSTRSSYHLDGFGGAVVPSGSSWSQTFFENNGSTTANLNGKNAALAMSEPLVGIQRQVALTGAIVAIAESHSLKFGIEYRRLSPILGVQPIEQSLLFNGITEALTANASRLSLFSRNGPQRPVFNYISLYAQDTWTLRPRLTLTYGVRWHLNKAPSEENGREALALSDVVDLSHLNVASAGSPLWRNTYNNFAPRVGIAYQVLQRRGRETVVRGGVGITYDATNSQVGYAFTDSYPFMAGQSVFNVTIPRSTSTISQPNEVPFVGFDPGLKLPYVMNWSVEVDRALGSNQHISAAYVGSFGRRLLQSRTYFEPGAGFSYLRLTSNGASSDYRALQFQFERRLSSGLQVLAAYTWSRSLDDFTQDSPARTLLRSDAPEQERGPSDFDVRHAAGGAVWYSIPTPINEGIGESLLRNWTINSTFNLRSGRPINVVYSVPTIYGFAYRRPDRVEGVPLYLTDPTAGGTVRINPAAFVIPNTSRQGTLARNSLRGFPFYQFDLGIYRKFAFNDRISLQFRLEAMNLFNHPNFEDPVGTDTSLGGTASHGGLFVPNATFGRSSSLLGRSLWNMPGGSLSSSYAGVPRTLQFSLKMAF